MENPRVSIIIPVYNRAKFIGATIESVLNQTFKDFELIVVDDCSTDDTINVIKKYEEKDSRIKLIVLNKNSGGPAKPRNEAVKIAKGEYIFFLDGDDLYLPQSLEKRINIFNQFNPDVINSNSWVIDNKNRIIDYVNGITSCLAVKKTLFDLDKVGLLNENLTGIDELEWLLRYACFSNGKPNIFYLEEPTILYRRGHTQISFFNYSSIIIKKFMERDIKFLNFLENFDCQYLDKKYIFETKFWIGYRLCLLGDFKEGRKFLKDSIFKLKCKSLFFYTVSFLGKDLYVTLDKVLRIGKSKIIKNFRILNLKNKYPNLYKESQMMIKKFLK